MKPWPYYWNIYNVRCYCQIACQFAVWQFRGIYRHYIYIYFYMCTSKSISTLGPEQNSKHLDIFQNTVSNENNDILIYIWLNFVSKYPIYNKSALVEVEVCSRTGDCLNQCSNLPTVLKWPDTMASHVNDIATVCLIPCLGWMLMQNVKTSNFRPFVTDLFQSQSANSLESVLVSWRLHKKHIFQCKILFTPYIMAALSVTYCAHICMIIVIITSKYFLRQYTNTGYFE